MFDKLLKMRTEVDEMISKSEKEITNTKIHASRKAFEEGKIEALREVREKITKNMEPTNRLEQMSMLGSDVVAPE